MKIFLGLDDTCGYYSRLESGFASLGLETELVIAYPSRAYPRTRKCSTLGSVVEHLGKKRLKHRQDLPLYYLYIIVESVALLGLYIYELAVCDVFIFAGGMTFLRGIDLPFYRLFGKKVIIVFHGSDSRPPYLNGAYVVGKSKLALREVERLTKKLYQHVRFCERHATHIVQLPYTGHFHSKKFINFLALGIPSIFNTTNQNMQERKTCKVLHAPSRPLQKGTPIIVETINELKSEGYSIELDIIVNKKPIDVFNALEQCDLVIDELHSDSPLAGFGSEAMAHGRPVVVGVNESETLLESLPFEMRPPSIICCHSNLYNTLKVLLDDINILEVYSEKGRKFIEKQWSADNVAKRYISLIDGSFPETWKYDPYDLQYISGWGLSPSALKKSLIDFAKRYSLRRMLLNDKPLILTRIQEVVNELSNS